MNHILGKKKTSIFLVHSHDLIRVIEVIEAIMIMYGGFRKFVGIEVEERPTHTEDLTLSP